ncbi:M3 family oligoendopeptidase [uncultured Vagococcus sp.]|uniref:M3 family oligoendopeptidase n=1 Tax=uncultured Vagococcus sp. TaxID=189676 RepID=UPI0028D4D77F|nr:M3 family oligoendopeptidase [uncultured Vagococcus sp.]
MKFTEFVYERPDYEAVKEEMTRQVAALKKADAQTVVEIAETINQIHSQFSSMEVLGMIRHSIDTANDFYSQENDYWNEYGPLYEELLSDYYQAMLASPYQELRKAFPKTFFLMAENKAKTFSSKIIELRQRENQLVSEYDKLIASAEVTFDGKQLTLPQLGPYREHENREIRRQATLAHSAYYASQEETIDDLFDQLVEVRTKMAQTLGFKDYVEMSYRIMNRFDYDREMVEVYRQEILSQVVPLAQKLYERQANRLDLATLAHYDLPLEYLTGNATPKGTPAEIVQKGLQMYRELSPETGEFMATMVKGELLDLLSKPGKQSGGYCDYIPKDQAPFIFANFNGTSGDIDVLTHEAGHAFQVYQSRWIQQPECVFPTYESCEIHSMSMEFFTWPWMHLFFEEQTAKYQYSHLAGAVKFLPYGVLVDHFQHEVYGRPNLTPAERKTVWRQLEKMYCPERHYEEDPFLEKGTYWFRQGHIFASPFYYIDYTLAQVCAFQFWKRSQVDKELQAWSDYLAICQVGGTKTFLEIIELANLTSPFEKGSLAQVMSAIDEYLSAVDDTQL